MLKFETLKIRVISAIIGLIILVVVSWSDQIVLGLAIFCVSIIGVHEFYEALSKAGYKPIRVIGYISCIPTIFIGFNGVFKRISSYIDLFKSINYLSFLVFIFILVLFLAMVLFNKRYSIVDVAITFMGALYVAFLFVFVVLTRNLDNPSTTVYDGFFFMWLIFIGWGTDTFAYLTGNLLGKHKLIPAVSANKTIEGSAGGVAGCILLTLVYGAFVSRHLGGIQLYHFVIIGLLNGIISQLGDLGASSIKRFTGIKDYGRIMPGHGGVLDRFDSILFVAPVVYFYISFIIL